MSLLPLPRPTETELEILQVLWELGPSTVRAIHNRLEDHKETGYTTTLKTLQRMADKGLVLRDESQRSHVYRAAGRAEETQRHLVHHLLQRAFRGSATQLVVRALSEHKATREELAEIRRILDELEARQSKGKRK